MPKLAMVPTHLTEAAFIVWALLLFLGGAWLGLLRMSINAICDLLVTEAIFLEKLTDGNSLLYVHVKVLAFIALRAIILQPIHAYLLFQLCLIRLLRNGFVIILKLIVIQCIFDLGNSGLRRAALVRRWSPMALSMIIASSSVIVTTHHWAISLGPGRGSLLAASTTFRVMTKTSSVKLFIYHNILIMILFIFYNLKTL